jgi:hypothetical protein
MRWDVTFLLFRGPERAGRMTRTDTGHCQVLHHVLALVVPYLVGFHLARPSRCCMPSGVASPAYSAMVQQFLRGRSDSSPSTNCLARHRGSTRANRSAIRLNRPSNASCRWAGSTL